MLRLPKYEVEVEASLGDAKAWTCLCVDELEMTLREPDRTPKAAPAADENEESDDSR